MTFGEKLLKARLALNLSQTELSEKAGISERSIYSYEQAGIKPRKAVLQRLADALNVSVVHLADDDKTNRAGSIDREIFLARAKSEYGSKGVREAREVLDRASALFAGGDLNDEAKDIFFQSLMEVYMESKAEAREKFTPRRRRKSRKAQPDTQPNM